MLPDDVLVEVFNFYVNIYDRRRYTLRNPWHALVHVCRRWRYLVFASPRRLNLRLEYGGHGPLSEVLDVWPVHQDWRPYLADVSVKRRTTGGKTALLHSSRSTRIASVKSTSLI